MQPSPNPTSLADTALLSVFTLFVIFIYSKAYSSQATWGSWEPASSLSSPAHPTGTISLSGFSSIWSCDLWVYRLNEGTIKTLLSSLVRLEPYFSLMTLWKMILSLNCIPSFLLHFQVKIILWGSFSLWQTFAMWPLLSVNSLRFTSPNKKTINTLF